MKENKYLLSFFGACIIIFILWNRVLREREPQKLLFIDTKLKLIIIIITVMICVMCIIYYIRVIFNYKLIPKPNWLINRYITYISLFVSTYIINAPLFIHYQLINHLPIKKFVEYTASYIVVYFEKYTTIYAIVPMLLRCLVSTVFVIDIYYFQELNYFYRSLSIFIYVLLFQYYLFIVTDFSTKYLDTLNLYLKFEKSNNMLILSLKDQQTFPGAWDVKKLKLQIMADLWDIYSNIVNFFQSINNMQLFFKPYFLLYSYINYLLGWSYILYINIIS